MLDDDGNGAELVASYSRTKIAKKSLEKGERVPQEVADHFRAFLSLDTSQLLTYGRDCFIINMNNKGSLFCLELYIGKLGSKNYRIDNAVREQPIAFRCPGNGQYYNALNAYVISDVVYFWMGSVQDCHILHYSSLKCPLKRRWSKKRSLLGVKVMKNMMIQAIQTYLFLLQVMNDLEESDLLDHDDSWKCGTEIQLFLYKPNEKYNFLSRYVE